jgi:hypothetical protein
MLLMDRDLEPRNLRETRLAAMHLHPAEFYAATRRRKHLARVEESLRVKCAFESLLLSEVDVGELIPHQIPLLDAHAVLPTEHAAKFNTGFQGILSERLRLLEIARFRRIE